MATNVARHKLAVQKQAAPRSTLDADDPAQIQKNVFSPKQVEIQKATEFVYKYGPKVALTNLPAPSQHTITKVLQKASNSAPGRNRGTNMVELDMYARAASMRECAPHALPALVSFDFAHGGGAEDDGLPGAPQWRRRLRLLVTDPSSSRMAAALQAAIVVLIVVSTVVVIVETVPDVRDSRAGLFGGLEMIVTFIFTLELALRWCACSSTAAFVTDVFNIIDMLAILPGFLEMTRSTFMPEEAYSSGAAATISLRIIRLLWLIRILRVAKIARHSTLLSICMAVLGKVWRSSIMVILGVILFQMLLSASLLYLVENDLCEELGIKCDGFDSIPAACWFSASTITTVGYGDVIPVTPVGKFIAGFFSICAVVTLALAGALLSHDFAEHFREERGRKRLELIRAAGAPRRGQDLKPERHYHDHLEFVELQPLLRDFRRANDRLVARLSMAAARRRAEDGQEGKSSAPPIMMPMLSLIQERSRILNTEMENFTYQEILGIESDPEVAGALPECNTVVFRGVPAEDLTLEMDASGMLGEMPQPPYAGAPELRRERVVGLRAGALRTSDNTLGARARRGVSSQAQEDACDCRRDHLHCPPTGACLASGANSCHQEGERVSNA
ncbi:unnamed protein product [Prorocentrum cordatum]|uniref:Ion transport domain-containing protein n=1 Tax=Prorocentrum cordatum TaxID=2364126 RepID=A0ABN9W7X1_9DINO|nr:unnamed protein product [Polarella glacialis]